jgi:hypothetical protein
MTWDDFSTAFLNAGAKAKAQEFAAIGEALKTNPTPNISGVTYSQMRAADAKMREMNTLIGPAMRGIAYVKKKMEDAATQAFKDANP